MRVQELFEAKAKRASLIEALRANCSRNLGIIAKSELRLLRGDTGRGQIEEDGKWWFESKPRTSPRKSQTENNFMMVWVTNSDAWADVPRRAFSSSCTTNYHAAANFGGSVYLIIPFDNVQSYAYCPTDFNYYQHWPKDGQGHLDLLSRMGHLANLQEIADAALAMEDKTSPLRKVLSKHRSIAKVDLSSYTNIQQIWKFSDMVADLMEYFAGPPNRNPSPHEKELADVISDHIDNFGMPPASWLKKYVTPKEMNVKVYDGLNKLPNFLNMTEAPEIWFEGQFIAITDPHNDSWLTNPDDGHFNHLVKEVLG